MREEQIYRYMACQYMKLCPNIFNNITTGYTFGNLLPGTTTPLVAFCFSMGFFRTTTELCYVKEYRYDIVANGICCTVLSIHVRHCLHS